MQVGDVVLKIAISYSSTYGQLGVGSMGSRVKGGPKDKRARTKVEVQSHTWYDVVSELLEIVSTVFAVSGVIDCFYPSTNSLDDLEDSRERIRMLFNLLTPLLLILAGALLLRFKGQLRGGVYALAFASGNVFLQSIVACVVQIALPCASVTQEGSERLLAYQMTVQC